MKIPEHLALSYLLAQFGAQQVYGTPGTVLMLVAGMLPDLDGISILGGWKCHLKYHRKLGHGLPVTLFGPLLLALAWSVHLESGSWIGLWLWLQLSLLLHLIVDFLFYRWPVQLLWPLSDSGIGFGLIGWNDLFPTFILYGATVAALVWPAQGRWVAVVGLSLLALYIGWRALDQDRPSPRWLTWLRHDWARGSWPLWRWLTGDFISR